MASCCCGQFSAEQQAKSKYGHSHAECYSANDDRNDGDDDDGDDDDDDDQCL